MIGIIILFVLVILFFITKRKYDEKNELLENIHLAVGIATVIVGAIVGYDELVLKKHDEEKTQQEKKHNEEKIQQDKAKLPPVLNAQCKLEKVGESDSCYWLKASLTYENKSERRINILFSSISVRGFKIASPPQTFADTFIVEDKDYWYSSDFTYYKENKTLYSRKIEHLTWYDFNELHNYTYIIKISKKTNYDVASLKVQVAIANIDTFPNFKFRRLFVHGDFELETDTVNNNKNIPLSNSAAFVAFKNYGYGWVISEYELYLKDSIKK